MDEKLNFSKIAALVVDADRYSTGIISQILRGFGVGRPVVVGSVEAAMKHLATGEFHILITESVLPDSSLEAFVSWIRHHPKTTTRYIPIVVLTGYTHFSRVTIARDSGVNSVVRKPVSPAVLYDHIAWSANTERPFIDADAYAGPCRRFRYGDAAPGFSRRVSDHPPDYTTGQVPAAINETVT